MLEGVEVNLHSWEPRNYEVGVIRYMPTRLILGGKNSGIRISLILCGRQGKNSI
jgi:hypothetical protein